MMSTTLKFFLGITAVIVILAVIVGFWLYSLSKPEITDLSGKAPYQDIVGKTFTLTEGAVIAKKGKHVINEAVYVLAKDETRTGITEGEIHTLSVGTAIEITAAKMYKEKVNGIALAYLLGTVFVKEMGQEVQFEYQWGKEVYQGQNPEFKLYSFFKAPWQEKAIEEKFRLD